MPPSTAAATPPPEPRLRVVRADHRYGATHALKDAHLTVAAGEVHALVGENGAGKSTLIRLLAGAETADVFSATIDGRPYTPRNPADARRAGLRFVHQELNVAPSLSVAETVHLGLPYPRTPLGTIDWRTLNTRTADTLSKLQLGHINPATVMHRLSAGDAMLVTLARALAAEPDGPAAGLYVFDEPTAALSAREADRLFDAILRLRATGAGILYVSHRMNEIFDLSDRVTVLRNGATVGVFDTSNTDRAALVQAMTGREGGLAGRTPKGRGDAEQPVVLSVRSLQTRQLNEVDLDVQAGLVTVVVGLPGSGRRALLRAFAGDATLHGGQVHVLGIPMKQSPHAAWQAGVAFVPDERRGEGLWLSGSVAANMLLPHLGRVTRAGWVRRRHEQREAEAWAARVGVRARGVRQPAWELSGGNQQKVVLARALAGQPQALLLGEPTRGVDVGAKEEIYDLVRNAAQQGTAVLVATSDLEEAFTLADRMVVMAHGRIVLDAAASDLTREAVLTAAFRDAAEEVAA